MRSNKKGKSATLTDIKDEKNTTTTWTEPSESCGKTGGQRRGVLRSNLTCQTFLSGDRSKLMGGRYSETMMARMRLGRSKLDAWNGKAVALCEVCKVPMNYERWLCLIECPRYTHTDARETLLEQVAKEATCFEKSIGLFLLEVMNLMLTNLLTKELN